MDNHGKGNGKDGSRKSPSNSLLEKLDLADQIYERALAKNPTANKIHLMDWAFKEALEEHARRARKG